MAGDHTATRILETAGEVFAEKGYAGATIRDICERAGVNLAAVNYYFRGKESLYVQTLQRAQSSHLREEEETLDGPGGTPPAVKLKNYIHQALTHMLVGEDEPWEMRLMMREIIDPTPAGSRVLRDHFRKRVHQLQEILAQILPPETLDHKRHQIGFSIMGQCTLYRGLGKMIPLIVEEEELTGHYGLDELADHIAEMSLAALGLVPPLTRSAERKPRHGQMLAVATQTANSRGRKRT
jgi:TetR/AcrR family transcriptional regulator, regulator of cefoperazone and chloramphenicol sensitivity